MCLRPAAPTWKDPAPVTGTRTIAARLYSSEVQQRGLAAASHDSHQQPAFPGPMANCQAVPLVRDEEAHACYVPGRTFDIGKSRSTRIPEPDADLRLGSSERPARKSDKEEVGYSHRAYRQSAVHLAGGFDQ
jgi:hypothetical protein